MPIWRISIWTRDLYYKTSYRDRLSVSPCPRHRANTGQATAAIVARILEDRTVRLDDNRTAISTV